MMPTFPFAAPKISYGGFSPVRLQGRTVRRGLPSGLVCHRPSCPLLPSSIPCSVSEMDALVSTSVRADLPLYPRGPRSGPGYAVPVHPHLIGPIRPTRRHIPTSPSCGLYQMPSLCIFHRPRRPTTGSELSSILFRNMSPSETTGNFPAACTQLLHRKHWPSTWDQSFGIPDFLTLRFW